MSKKQKTALIILIISLATVGGILLYDYIKTRPPKFKNQIYKMEHIQKFQDEHMPKTDESIYETNTENDGGGKDVFIKNRIVLKEKNVMDNDEYFAIAKQVEKGINTLVDISKDISKTGNSKEYFNTGSTKFNELFGIDNNNDFDKFIKQVKNMKIDKKILSAEIQQNSISNTENTVNFNLLITSDTSIKEVFKIRCAIVKNTTTGSKDCFVYWIN
jgi:hypothetical protein